jgi:rod shape-determining protein MreB
LVSVATDATSVEREALRDVLENVGVRQVFLVDQTLASAIGAGLPVGQSSGNVVVSLGAGIIEMSVISLGTSILSKSLRWGGQYLDDVIKKSIRIRAQVDISSSTAEFLKTHIFVGRGRSKTPYFNQRSINHYWETD